MNARTIVIAGISAFIILCGTCVGIHLKPIMGKLRAATAAPQRPVPPAEHPRPATVQETVDRILAGPGPSFEAGTAGLTMVGQERLDAVYPLLLRYPRLRLEIRGYPDSPSPQASELGSQRAEAVRAYLVFHGISVRRITTIGEVAAPRDSIPACRFSLMLY
jgi:outer membrane protein OmpA-like peptidoglycan-associated protein